MSTSHYDKILLWGKFATAENDQDIPPLLFPQPTYDTSSCPWSTEPAAAGHGRDCGSHVSPPGVLESDNDDRHDDGSSPGVSSDADSLSDVEPDDPVYTPSGGVVHTITTAPSTSTRRSTCDVPVTVDRHLTTKQGDVREDEPAAKRRRLAESTSTTSSVAGPIPGGSSTASRTS